MPVISFWVGAEDELHRRLGRVVMTFATADDWVTQILAAMIIHAGRARTWSRRTLASRPTAPCACSTHDLMRSNAGCESSTVVPIAKYLLMYKTVSTPGGWT